jgi:hypothetical protein
VSTCTGTPGAPVAGRVSAGATATFTLNLVAGTSGFTGTSAGTASSTAGLAPGMVIGALSVAPLQSPVGYPQSLALAPGTYVESLGPGALIVLSEKALVTGNGLFAAACAWTLV